MTTENLCRMSIKYMGEDMFKCGSRIACDYQYQFAKENWCALYWSFHPPKDVSRINDLATHVDYILNRCQESRGVEKQTEAVIQQTLTNEPTNRVVPESGKMELHQEANSSYQCVTHSDIGQDTGRISLETSDKFSKEQSIPAQDYDVGLDLPLAERLRRLKPREERE
jgi:hypothetical protein